MSRDQGTQIRKQLQAIEIAVGSWSAEGRKDPEEEIRELREGWGERLRQSFGRDQAASHSDEKLGSFLSLQR